MKKWKLNEVTMSLDVLPDKKEEEVFQEILSLVKSEPKKSIKNTLKGLVPERYLLFLLEHNGIDPSEQGSTISNEKIRSFTKGASTFLLKSTAPYLLKKRLSLAAVCL